MAELERSALEAKDRDELMTIAAALGGKPASRAKKADIVDLILELTGVTTTAGDAAAEEPAPSPHRPPEAASEAPAESGSARPAPSSDAPDGPDAARSRMTGVDLQPTRTGARRGRRRADVGRRRRDTSDQPDGGADPTTDAAVRRRPPTPRPSDAQGRRPPAPRPQAGRRKRRAAQGGNGERSTETASRARAVAVVAAVGAATVAASGRRNAPTSRSTASPSRSRASSTCATRATASSG